MIPLLERQFFNKEELDVDGVTLDLEVNGLGRPYRVGIMPFGAERASDLKLLADPPA